MKKCNYKLTIFRKFCIKCKYHFTIKNGPLILNIQNVFLNKIITPYYIFFQFNI